MKDANRVGTVYGARARIGVIVPPTNTANEAEWNRMAPAGVSIHAARMALHTDTESEAGRKALYGDIEHATADLALARVDVVAYGCTAGSMISPPSQLSDFMSSVADGTPAVTTAGALVAALRALGARRISLATPYHDALNAHERDFLAGQGIETVALAGLGYGEGGVHEFRNIARVPVSDVERLARSVDRPEADAVLISCTDLATLEAIPRLESELGKPVVSSNQATFWAALRAAGIDDRFDNFGRLLKEH